MINTIDLKEKKEVTWRAKKRVYEKRSLMRIADPKVKRKFDYF